MEQNNGSIVYIGWDEIRLQLSTLKPQKYYGIPRGGEIIAQILPKGWIANTPEEADAFLDDLIDSGKTRDYYIGKYGLPFYGLFHKKNPSEWYQFPWEVEGTLDAESHIQRVLQFLGEDTQREGLKDTPRRYVKFLREFMQVPEWNFTTFDSEGYDQMIVQTNIPFYSLCEHHIAPFFGEGHIAYIPDGKIVGLSKLARTLDEFSRRLQNQERITQQVAEFLLEQLNPKGVAVVLKAKHLCMEMRGVKKHDTFTTTSKMIGVFEDDINARNEFLNLIK
jgi:GTP cyclohydrolase IA